MFQFNLKNHSTYFYPDVQSAYKEYLQSFATKSDYDYYRDCCGFDLDKVNDPKIMKSIFENVFKDVVFSGEVSRILTTSKTELEEILHSTI